MKNTANRIHLHAIVPQSLSGKRLDQVLATLFPEYSRTKLQEWLRLKQVTLNGNIQLPRFHVIGGEEIIVDADLPKLSEWRAEDLPLNIIYEDDSILVINKPAGMVVHPAAGNYQNTLANALLHYCPALAQVPRAGIVHRLDKDTSGLLVTAKTLNAQTHLVAQLQARSITREYEAIVIGVMTGGGTIDAPIGRHPSARQRMAIIQSGKPAVTHYRVLERFRGHTHIKIQLETGRTHQIRVHMSQLHYPIVGDTQYGARGIIPKGACEKLIQGIRQFKRQALHAKHLALIHPVTGKLLSWSAPLPDDMQHLLDLLREDIKG